MAKPKKRDAGRDQAVSPHEPLRQSADQFHRFVADVKDYAIFLLDPEGRVLTWNAGARMTKGYDAGEIIGQHFSKFYPQESIQKGWPEHELAVAAAEGRFEDEGWRLRKDGSRFWANVVITALRDEDGTLRGFSKVTRDLTERKRGEERLRDANIELERRVEERTAELREKNDALLAAARQKDEFLAMLAHELRNPLAPIGNGIQLLRFAHAAGDETMFAQSLGIMEKQLGHLTRLVDDLLDVHRITQGMIELRKEPIELADAVESAVASIRQRAQARNHSLTALLPPDPIILDADPTRLEQILVNLLENAVKYTPPGGHITLSAEQNDGMATIRVKDSGLGMTAELIPQVFELFTQGRRTLDRSGGGLGIGLTMVKRLVELHGGAVSAFSEGPGLGSEFVVSLPVTGERPRSDPPSRAQRQAKGLRILVVEDVPDTAQTFVMLVKAMGHDARAFHDGPSALVAYRTYQPDVVLLDIGLPGMSGYEVARRLRSERGSKRPLLLAVTGYGGEEERRRTREAGFDFHMTKPLDPVSLEKLLASVLSP
jgi:PAS domain S-box-containing protein